MNVRLPKIDPLIVLIIAAVILAIVLPIRGTAADYFSIATNLAIALLFFLYGARLSTSEALAGLKNWKLHLTILAFTFAVYPAIGLALEPIIPDHMYPGILYLTLVPSTVQSSVAFTSIARGNVAGAIVSASASNLAGVFLTPLLVMALMSGNFHINGSIFAEIASLLLAPFVLGQLARKWVGALAAKNATKVVDRGSIAMVVYSAFSAGVVGGLWRSIGVQDVLFLIIFSIILVAVMLWLTRAVPKRLGFPEEDIKAIEFCGTKKSLATGLPMASVIFGAGGAQLAMLVLPLMIFHQIQLMMCSWLAARYATIAP